MLFLTDNSGQVICPQARQVSSRMDFKLSLTWTYARGTLSLNLKKKKGTYIYCSFLLHSDYTPKHEWGLMISFDSTSSFSYQSVSFSTSYKINEEMSPKVIFTSSHSPFKLVLLEERNLLWTLQRWPPHYSSNGITLGTSSYYLTAQQTVSFFSQLQVPFSILFSFSP